MSTGPDPIGRIGLSYFGSTTASISHELKNALAIIRENAGLMNDYLLLADKGQPLDLSRFRTVAGRIEEQIRRADGIIKTMNRFGHSVDEPVKAIDLHEAVALGVQLSLRQAAMRQVRLVFQPGSEPATVRTDPFLLLTLVGRCLSFVLNLTAAGQVLTLQSARCKEGGRISLEPLTLPAGRTMDALAQSETALLDALSATFSMDAPARRATITVGSGLP